MSKRTWDQEPVEIEARPNGTSVFSLRLPTSEFHQMLAAARREGVKASDYMRSALRLRLGGGMPVAPTVTWCISTPYADMIIQPTTWTETRYRADVDMRVTYG